MDQSRVSAQSLCFATSFYREIDRRRQPGHSSLSRRVRCCAHPSQAVAADNAVQPGAATEGSAEQSADADTPLASALIAEAGRVRVNLFCPGHKQGENAHPVLRSIVGADAMLHDVPELPALDNLFAPEGVIADAQRLATETFVGKSAPNQGWQTYFLVNGSTSGIEAAVLATVRPGRKIMLPRNAHQSAIHALVLSGAEPVWIQPIYDASTDLLHPPCTDDIAAALKEHQGELDAVLLVSPSYHGVCCDVAQVAELTRAAGVVLIVDEAHGAHFGFHEALPRPAARCGADITIQSAHKTLGALTQAAMLHVRSSRYISHRRVASALRLVQTTSPSYLLLASLDAARAQLAQNGRELQDRTIALANLARERISRIPGFSVLNASDRDFAGFDPTRLTVLLPAQTSGYDLDDHLIDRFGVYAELPSFRHMTFIFSPGNTKQDVDVLIASLQVFSATTSSTEPAPHEALRDCPTFGLQSRMSPRDAFFAEAQLVPAAEAVGRISVDSLCPYPPGIPILLPGEIISEDCIALLRAVLNHGGSVSGAADQGLTNLRVVAE